MAARMQPAWLQRPLWMARQDAALGTRGAFYQQGQHALSFRQGF